MPPLNARVWRRYGQLRIYVSADHDPVGWFDPRTGQSQLSRPDLHDGFWAAVRAECQQLLRDGHISESALPPEVSPMRSRRPPQTRRPPSLPQGRRPPSSPGWRPTRKGTTWPATRRARRPAPGPGNCAASVHC